MILSFFGLVVLLCATSSVWAAQQEPPQRSFARASELLSVASEAARHGMQDLSFRAAREALAGGVPFPGQSADVPASSADDPQQFVIEWFEGNTRTLVGRWREQQFDGVRVYEFLRDVVLPTGDPNSIHIYERASDDDQQGFAQPERSVGALLVDAAVTAGRSDELRGLLELRLSNAASRIHSGLLLLLMAQTERDPQSTVHLLERLANDLQQSDPPLGVLTLSAATLRLAHELDLNDAALPLIEKTLLILAAKPVRSMPEEEHAAGLMLWIAREHLLSGRTEQARTTLAKLTTSLDPWQLSAHEREAWRNLHRDCDLSVAKLALAFGMHDEATARIHAANVIDVADRRSDSELALRSLEFADMFQPLPAEPRYELLLEGSYLKIARRWLQPAVLVSATSQTPVVFLDSLPPHQREAFKSREPNGRAGVINTAQLLVEAADACGQMDELTGLLDAADDNDRIVLMYRAVLSLHRGEPDAMRDLLITLNNSLSTTTGGSLIVDHARLPISLAALAIPVPETRAAAIDLLRTMQARRIGADSIRVEQLPPLQRLIVEGKARPHDRDASALIAARSPRHWLAASPGRKPHGPQHAGAAAWVAQDDTLTLASGSGDDQLFLPWPMTGSFEFSVRSLTDSTTTGSLGYGGLVCADDHDSGTVFVAVSGSKSAIARSSLRFPGDRFLRRSVRVEGDRFTFLVNGHPVHVETRGGAASPWVSLASRGLQGGVWADLRISGDPVIPRSVMLSDGAFLQGWSSPLFESNLDDLSRSESRRRSGAQSSETDFDWQQSEGELLSSHVPDSWLRGAGQSLLQYDRPLASGERIDWEFSWSSSDRVASAQAAVIPAQTGIPSARFESHPALGRLVFLLRPSGLRLRWLTAAEPRFDPLPPDNECIPTAGLSGDLVLREGWNSATLQIRDDAAVLSVNGTEIYEHPLGDGDSRHFGLYHERDLTAARVRNVRLAGPWPERLTPELLAQLTQPVNDEPHPSDAIVLDQLLRSASEQLSPTDVLRSASRLSPADRFERLAAAVIPRSRDDDWNMRFAFAPMFNGSEVVAAPALELIRAARSADRLDDLRQRMAAVDGSRRELAAGRIAGAALLSLEVGDRAAARDQLDQLLASIRTNAARHSESPATNAEDWPALLAAQQSLTLPELRPVAIELLKAIVVDELSPTAGSPSDFQRLHASVSATAEHMSAIAAGELLPLSADWHAGRMLTADLDQKGLPPARWLQSPDGTITHVGGCEADTLGWHLPLRGNFTVRCELIPVAGHLPGIAYAGKLFGSTKVTGAVTTPAEAGVSKRPSGPVSLRLSVNAAKYQVLIDEELIASGELLPDADPWLRIHAALLPGASIKSFRIEGEPEHPEHVNLDTSRELTGWNPPFFGNLRTDQPFGAAGSDWRSDQGALVGLKRATLADSEAESLLHWSHPLRDDGTLTWSFRYQAGELLAHPVLDRTAFVLDKDRGVLLHDITLGVIDESGADPGAEFAVPENQLARPLPLIDNDWNTMQLEVHGDTLLLILNGTPVFRYTINAGAQRLFGFFHDPGETGVRVRDMSWTSAPTVTTAP